MTQKQNKESEIISQLKGYEKCAEYYDLFANNDDIPFFLDIAKKCHGSILDLASGTGRITIPLAKAGFSITGLEFSPAMNEIATRKISKLSVATKKRIKLIQGDMISFKLDQLFKLIIIPSSFGHCLTTAQQKSCLVCIHEHLTNNGLFILDLYPGDTINKSGSFSDELRKIDNKSSVKRFGSYVTDFNKKISNYKLIFQIFEKNILIKEIEEESSVAVIYNEDINLLIKNVGFEIINEFCNWKKKLYKPNKNFKQRILVLKKT